MVQQENEAQGEAGFARELWGKEAPMKKRILTAAAICIACLVLAGLVIGFCFWSRNYRIPRSPERQQSVEALTTTSYNGLFLAMYGNDSFDMEDFAYFRAQEMWKAQDGFRNLRELGDYLERAFDAGGEIGTVYLAIDPYAISQSFYQVGKLYRAEYQKNLTDFMAGHPGVTFEILLPCYSMEMLKALSEKELDTLTMSLLDFVALTAPYENTKVFFMGDELFFNSNPGNFDEAGECMQPQQRLMLIFAFRDDTYLLTAENSVGRMNSLKEQVTERKEVTFADLSGRSILFFGDSIMANDANTFTVPGVVASLSGATVYNMAVGGTTASVYPDPAIVKYDLNTVLDIVLDGDMSLLDETRDETDNAMSAFELFRKTDRHADCVVLSFGLNDYFGRQPVSGEDAYDVTTYQGALRTAIQRVRTAFPEAQILVLSPTKCANFEFGREVHDGNVLETYVKAAEEVAESEAVAFLDQYDAFDIREENYKSYIPDLVHPNEAFKFALAERICRKLETMMLQ